ncbi:MAG: hypothetical protein FWD86_00750, partial [Firmicutes bacterium]|nr:hypothetical protein [Bacillota bacterium]
GQDDDLTDGQFADEEFCEDEDDECDDQTGKNGQTASGNDDKCDDNCRTDSDDRHINTDENDFDNSQNKPFAEKTLDEEKNYGVFGLSQLIKNNDSSIEKLFNSKENNDQSNLSGKQADLSNSDLKRDKKLSLNSDFSPDTDTQAEKLDSNAIGLTDNDTDILTQENSTKSYALDAQDKVYQPAPPVFKPDRLVDHESNDEVEDTDDEIPYEQLLAEQAEKEEAARILANQSILIGDDDKAIFQINLNIKTNSAKSKEDTDQPSAHFLPSGPADPCPDCPEQSQTHNVSSLPKHSAFDIHIPPQQSQPQFNKDSQSIADADSAVFLNQKLDLYGKNEHSPRDLYQFAPSSTLGQKQSENSYYQKQNSSFNSGGSMAKPKAIDNFFLSAQDSQILRANYKAFLSSLVPVIKKEVKRPSGNDENISRDQNLDETTSLANEKVQSLSQTVSAVETVAAVPFVDKNTQSKKFVELNKKQNSMGDSVTLRPHNASATTDFSKQNYYYKNQMRLWHHGMMFVLMLVQIAIMVVVHRVLAPFGAEFRTLDIWLYSLSVVGSFVVFPLVAFIFAFKDYRFRALKRQDHNSTLIWRLAIVGILWMLIFLINVLLGVLREEFTQFLATLILPMILVFNVFWSMILHKAFIKSGKFNVDN